MWPRGAACVRHLSPHVRQRQPQWEDDGQDDKIGDLFPEGVWPSQAQRLVFVFLFLLQNLRTILGCYMRKTCTRLHRLQRKKPYLIYVCHAIHGRRDLHRDLCAVGDVFISFSKDRKERSELKAFGIFFCF